MRRPVLLLLLMASCVRNPATGKRQLVLISEEEEIALGQQAKKQVEQSMPLYGNEALQQYVEGLGMNLARSSERPQLPWSFQVLDDASVNAFALPGGPIFITRGMLTHVNSEAELVSVLGHEAGHVTGRHSAAQLSRAQLAQLGLGVGAILVPDLREYGALASAGVQLLLLQNSRSAEKEADQLGFRYTLEQQYDVREMEDLFVTLERVGERQGARLPEWLSTHPDPGNRVQSTQARIAELGNRNLDSLKVEAARFLSQIDGLVYGPDPRQGFFRGQQYLHPQMRFQARFPEGWATQNQPQAVVAVSPNKGAAVQLGLAGSLSPEEALQQFYALEGVRPLPQPAEGLTALPSASGYFEAQTQQGPVAGLVTFVRYGDRTFQWVGFTGAASLPQYDAAFRQTVGSFAALTDPAALKVEPARVQVVTVPKNMTLAEFQAQFPSSIPLDELALINGLNTQARLQAGQKFKRVVGKSLRAD